jgi:DNA-binding transcriptional LysR family regulator
MRFDSAEALKATLEAGSGVSMLPFYTVREEIRNRRLRRIRPAESPLFMKVHLMVRGGSYMPPAVEAFIASAKETLF